MTVYADDTGARPAEPARSDAALGVAMRSLRAGRTVGRVAFAPARLVTHAPLIRPALRRIETDLAYIGSLERARLLARVEELLAGPLTDAVARSLAQNRVVERVAAEVVSTADLDAVVDAILEDVRTERLLERALASPGLERLMVQVLESRFLDALTERVLASPEIERVVNYVASSPQVREAVTRQTQSFAEEMAEGVRRRTQSVDDRAERTVRSWLHRPRPQPS